MKPSILPVPEYCRQKTCTISVNIYSPCGKLFDATIGYPLHTLRRSKEIAEDLRKQIVDRYSHLIDRERIHVRICLDGFLAPGFGNGKNFFISFRKDHDTLWRPNEPSTISIDSIGSMFLNIRSVGELSVPSFAAARAAELKRENWERLLTDIADDSITEEQDAAQFEPLQMNDPAVSPKVGGLFGTKLEDHPAEDLTVPLPKAREKDEDIIRQDATLSQLVPQLKTSADCSGLVPSLHTVAQPTATISKQDKAECTSIIKLLRQNQQKQATDAPCNMVSASVPAKPKTITFLEYKNSLPFNQGYGVGPTPSEIAGSKFNQGFTSAYKGTSIIRRLKELGKEVPYLPKVKGESLSANDSGHAGTSSLKHSNEPVNSNSGNGSLTHQIASANSSVEINNTSDTCHGPRQPVSEKKLAELRNTYSINVTELSTEDIDEFISFEKNRSLSLNGNLAINPKFAILWLRCSDMDLWKICYTWRMLEITEGVPFLTFSEAHIEFFNGLSERKKALICKLEYILTMESSNLTCVYCELELCHRTLYCPLFVSLPRRDARAQSLSKCRACFNSLKYCRGKKDTHRVDKPCGKCHSIQHVTDACTAASTRKEVDAVVFRTHLYVSAMALWDEETIAKFLDDICSIVSERSTKK